MIVLPPGPADVTSSSFDDTARINHHPVEDDEVTENREVTRSSFDDTARINDHPTGF
jgi:hypothetical protein